MRSTLVKTKLRNAESTIDLDDAGYDASASVRWAALSAFAIRVASAAIAYVLQVVLARWMGSTEYGIFVYVWVWVIILGGLSSAGFGIAAMRFLPEYTVRRDHARIRGILLGSRLVAGAIATCVMLLGLAVVTLLSDRLDNAYVLPLTLILFCVPLYTLTDVQDGIGRANAWVMLGLLPPYILRPLLLLVVFAGARALDFPMTATTAAGSAIVATWITGLVQLVCLERRLGATIAPGPATFEPAHWLKTSFPIFLIYAFELVLQNCDVLVLSITASPSDVGVYFAALKTISLIAFVHYSVGSSVAGRLSALKAMGDAAGLSACVRDAARWTFWPSLAAAVVLLIAGKPLLGLFGEAFTAGYPVMAILVVGLLIRAAVGPAEFVLRMLGEEKACAMVLGAAAALSLALNLLLVPSFGATGAATATALSLSLAAIAFYVVARRRLGFGIAVWS